MLMLAMLVAMTACKDEPSESDTADISDIAGTWNEVSIYPRVLTVQEDGTYTYVVTEVPGNEAGVTYDDTVYTYVVTIKEGPHKNEAGEDVQGLYAEVTMNGQTAEDLEASFVNI